MLNCSMFTIHRFVIKVFEFGKPINLYVFGDVHRFAKGCSEEKWLQFLDTAKRDTNTFFLGMGDYDDFASLSEREIRFMKGRLLGLIEGNHYGVFSMGGYDNYTTDVQYVELSLSWL